MNRVGEILYQLRGKAGGQSSFLRQLRKAVRSGQQSTARAKRWNCPSKYIQRHPGFFRRNGHRCFLRAFIWRLISHLCIELNAQGHDTIVYVNDDGSDCSDYDSDAVGCEEDSSYNDDWDTGDNDYGSDSYDDGYDDD